MLARVCFQKDGNNKGESDIDSEIFLLLIEDRWNETGIWPDNQYIEHEDELIVLEVIANITNLSLEHFHGAWDDSIAKLAVTGVP